MQCIGLFGAALPHGQSLHEPHAALLLPRIVEGDVLCASWHDVRVGNDTGQHYTFVRYRGPTISAHVYKWLNEHRRLKSILSSSAHLTEGIEAVLPRRLELWPRR